MSPNQSSYKGNWWWRWRWTSGPAIACSIRISGLGRQSSSSASQWIGSNHFPDHAHL